MDILTFTLILIIYFTSMAAFLYLYKERQAKDSESKQLNNTSVSKHITDQIDTLEEQINKFDSRINNSWETITATKQAVESLKIQFDMKRFN